MFVTLKVRSNTLGLCGYACKLSRFSSSEHSESGKTSIHNHFLTPSCRREVTVTLGADAIVGKADG